MRIVLAGALLALVAGLALSPFAGNFGIGDAPALSRTSSTSAPPASTGEGRWEWIEAQTVEPGRKIQVAVLIPAGKGPFPLAVINHGSSGKDEEKRRKTNLGGYRRLGEWLAERGFAIALPLRRGYGQLGGPWRENAGVCREADYHRVGLEAASDISAAITAVSKVVPVREKALVIGQSAGGLGAIALSSRRPSNVFAYVNFSGGRGHKNGGCAPDRLVSAMGRFGQTAREPTLWLYSENDSYFGPDLSTRMHAAYVSNGGRATFKLLPPIKDDGHFLISSNDGARRWKPELERFLNGLKRHWDAEGLASK